MRMLSGPNKGLSVQALGTHLRPYRPKSVGGAGGGPRAGKSKPERELQRGQGEGYEGVSGSEGEV